MKQQERWVEVIQQVAKEQGYEVAKGDNLRFQVFIDRWNAVAFQVWNNKSSGYIEVSQWVVFRILCHFIKL